MSRHRPYKRTDRLGPAIQQVVAAVCQRESHEELLRQVVVTGVDVTRDLAVATVHYYALGGDREALAEALDRARGFVRRRVGEEIRMRRTPEMRFVWDDSIDQGRRVEEILRELDLPPSDEAEPDGPSEPDAP